MLGCPGEAAILFSCPSLFPRPPLAAAHAHCADRAVTAPAPPGPVEFQCPCAVSVRPWGSRCLEDERIVGI